MTNTKHTPRPWRTIESTNTTTRTVVGPDFPGQGYIADVNLCRTNDAQDVDGEANARLIAAAPELLAACQALLDGILFTRGASMSEDRWRTLTTIARQAINKAEG